MQCVGDVDFGVNVHVLISAEMVIIAPRLYNEAEENTTAQLYSFPCHASAGGRGTVDGDEGQWAGRTAYWVLQIAYSSRHICGRAPSV